MKIREIILKASSFWILIGTLAVTLGMQGLHIPEWVPDLFSQGFIDALLIAVGAVLDFVSFVRVIFAPRDTEVQALEVGKVKALSFYKNPFKMAA